MTIRTGTAPGHPSPGQPTSQACPPHRRTHSPIDNGCGRSECSTPGLETLRDAGGPVTAVILGPKWLVPRFVVTTSPKGIRDVLGRSDAFAEKNIVHSEMRRLLGGNLFDLTHEPWLPRRRAIQPVFTKHHVRAFGADMAQAAETIAVGWAPGGDIDLDAQSRRLTLRALGRSVLGLDLDERAEAVAEPVEIALSYIADRALSPIRAPWWLPTPHGAERGRPPPRCVALCRNPASVSHRPHPRGTTRPRVDGRHRSCHRRCTDRRGDLQ